MAQIRAILDYLTLYTKNDIIESGGDVMEEFTFFLMVVGIPSLLLVLLAAYDLGPMPPPRDPNKPPE